MHPNPPLLYFLGSADPLQGETGRSIDRALLKYLATHSERDQGERCRLQLEV